MSEEEKEITSSRNPWIAVAVLTYVNVINYMDRYGVSGVLVDIEEEFNIEHWQSGLLQTGLIICYLLSAPVFGYLGDRYSRKWLMIAGVAIWATASLTATFMPDYWSFMAVRASVGLGEAGYTAIAPAVISDMFAKQRRTKALGIFYLAIPVGCGLGYVVSSVVAGWGIRVISILVFVAVAAMIIFLEEIERGFSEAEEYGDIDDEKKRRKTKGEESFKAFISDVVYLAKNKSFVLTTIAQTCLTFCTGALAWWGPYYVIDALKLRDEWGLDTNIEEDSVAFVFGAELTAAGVIGLILGSGLSYVLRPRIAWIDPSICGLSMLIAAPFLFVAIAFADQFVAMTFVMVFFGELLLNMNWAVAVDIMLYVLVPYRRATGQAIQVMVCKALGEAGSPYFVGLMSDAFNDRMLESGRVSTFNDTTTATMSEVERDYYAFRYAMYFTIGLELIGSFFYLATSYFVVADREKAKLDYEKGKYRIEIGIDMY